jgi:hypothetical protein
MAKFSTPKCTLFLIALLVYIFQYNMYAQDYDFEQTDDQFGLVVMEAEHFTELIIQDEESTWDSIFEPIGFSGTSAMQASPAEPRCSPYATAIAAIENSAILSYKINFVKAAKTYVWLRECHAADNDDSNHAGLDDEIPDSCEFIACGTDSVNLWYWIGQLSGCKGRVFFTVTEGIHDFKLYIRECGLKIDKIVLTTDESYKPNILVEEGPEETLPAPSNVESLVSHKFGLYPAYPNPFSSSTTLSYNLVNSGYVSLNVYDLLGHKVATLVDNFQKAGIHELIFNANDLNNHRLADGIYVIELKTGKQYSRIKVQLMR